VADSTNPKGKQSTSKKYLKHVSAILPLIFSNPINIKRQFGNKILIYTGAKRRKFEILKAIHVGPDRLAASQIMSGQINRLIQLISMHIANEILHVCYDKLHT
jgi:hypothetical protein